MKLRIIFILVAIVLFFNYSLTDRTISGPEVKEMLDAIKSAGRDRDSVKLTSFFTSDAVIVIDLPANMGGRMEMGVTQYREQLSQTWSLPAEFTFDVEDESYTISKDGKSAEASSTMIEEVMMGGRVIISSRSKEEMRIVAVDGKPAISNVYAKITFNQ